MKYGDLTNNPGHGEGIACGNFECDDFAISYSAHAGDYFMARDEDEIKCNQCDEPMGLLRTVTVQEWVS